MKALIHFYEFNEPSDINSFLRKTKLVENSFTTVYVSNIRVAIFILVLLQFRQKQWLVLQKGRAL